VDNPINELSTRESCTLITTLSKASDTLDITGGEPLERTDLEELLIHARLSGMKTVLNTKGTGLELRPEIMKNTDALVISLDSLDRGKLSALIGRSLKTADALLNSLQYAVSRSRMTGTRLILSCVATPDNLPDVGGVLAFAMKNRLGFHISPEIIGTKVNPALRGNPDYRQLMDRILRLKRLGRGILGIPQYLHGIRDFIEFPCHPLLMPTIRPDGKMYYPCLESGQAHRSLLENKTYQETLDSFRNDFGEIPNCSECCHIFCHMALSLLQRHPLSALMELRHWM
jgi:hypothetical protein